MDSFISLQFWRTVYSSIFYKHPVQRTTHQTHNSISFEARQEHNLCSATGLSFCHNTYSRTWQHTAELNLVLKGNNTLRYEFFFEFIYIIKFKEILLWFILILLAKSISFHLSKHHHPVIFIFLSLFCYHHLVLVHISQSSVFHLNHSLRPMRRRGTAWAKL